MNQKYFFGGMVVLTALILAGPFAAFGEAPPQVSLRGQPLSLWGNDLQVGNTLPRISLPDGSLNMVELSTLKGKVSLVSVVPSLDTPTCEEQTHILSEKNGGLDQTVNLVTISRDLPFAQTRFAKNAKITNIKFLSDYRDAEFGKASGLLLKENRLLARAVMVLDRSGVIRYLEIVPELSALPAMQKAFDFARNL